MKDTEKDSPLKTKNAIVKTASINVRVLSIEGKQVTLSVFRQLKKENLIDEFQQTLRGKPWGIVNYFWGGCNNDHLHIVWQKFEELRRDCLFEKRKWIIEDFCIKNGHRQEDSFFINQAVKYAKGSIYRRWLDKINETKPQDNFFYKVRKLGDGRWRFTDKDGRSWNIVTEKDDVAYLQRDYKNYFDALEKWEKLDAYDKSKVTEHFKFHIENIIPMEDQKADAEILWNKSFEFHDLQEKINAKRKERDEKYTKLYADLTRMDQIFIAV